MMRVTFDSNVWRIVSSPETFPNEKSIIKFKAIRETIQHGEITPCLPEIIFTLEAIKKNKRQEFLARYVPNINISEKEDDSSNIRISLRIGPNINQHPGNNPYLSKHLRDALDLGFKIMRCPRTAGIKNPDIQDKYYIDDKGPNRRERQKKFMECLEAIEKRGCGIKHIKDIGTSYNGHYWLDGIKKSTQNEWPKIAKAVDEWADGDSIAAHVAYKNEYFCTRDIGKSGGTNSILSEQNRDWLKSQYGIEFVTPEELAGKIRVLQ
jgi:hypothetical protein